MDVSRTGAPALQTSENLPNKGAAVVREIAVAAALVPSIHSSSTVSRSDLDAAVESVNKLLQQAFSSLRFTIDDTSGHVVVKLVDDTTNTVLKQFPTEQMLAIARDITRIEQGMLVSEKT